ncbi:MAG: ATP-binding cassette domain-containing protein [Cyclobacteriaceae bacterium]|nr:ATP-binding cassette domain-containing protein [Cyclobacteriaceae bacterium]
MKIYFRILKYAPGYLSRIGKFFFYAIFGVIFSAGYLALTMPMLKILFDPVVSNTVPELPQKFELSRAYAEQTFNHYFIGIVQQYGAHTTLLIICIGIVVLIILGNTLRYLERLTASRIKVDVVKNMRMDIFRNVSNLDIGYFNNQRKGDLMSRFTNDMGEVEASVFNSLKSVLKEPVTLIVYFTVLFAISFKLTLFTLILLPVTGGLVAEIIKRLKRKAKQSQESMGRIVNILDETFGGMRVIKAFNARNFILKKIDDETNYHRKVNLSIARKNELSSPLSEVLGVIIVAVILYYGGNLVLGGSGELQPQEFMGFLVFYASMIQPAKNLSNGITSLQKGTVAAERIFKVIDTEPAIKNKEGAIEISEFKESIEFRNVSFTYGGEMVLKNIYLNIQRGKTIALVGPSGGGKSTLADLVPRFYDPTQGEVLLDGKALPEYDIESLRRLMGVVTQESILFNDTIFNNIAFGMENVKEDDVIHAARVANAHDFIMQTGDGYQTYIGDRGSKLSGGQRQRLAIARAVLKNPPILILDEATSALDSESERLVQDALTNLMKNRTSIVIAHRLSTIQHADEIVVLQDGHIAERGTHNDLVQQNGLYKKLSEIQKA